MCRQCRPRRTTDNHHFSVISAAQIRSRCYFQIISIPCAVMAAFRTASAAAPPWLRAQAAQCNSGDDVGHAVRRLLFNSRGRLLRRGRRSRCACGWLYPGALRRRVGLHRSGGAEVRRLCRVVCRVLIGAHRSSLRREGGVWWRSRGQLFGSAAGRSQLRHISGVDILPRLFQSHRQSLFYILLLCCCCLYKCFASFKEYSFLEFLFYLFILRYFLIFF